MSDTFKFKVVVNGCFDLFHDGHKHLLNIASKYCSKGKIFVLLNSDDSVRDLKGSGRPYYSYIIRKQYISEYLDKIKKDPKRHTVHKVVKFDTEQQLSYFINLVRPDMIIKGSDRPDIRSIVGSKHWPVLIVPRIKDIDGEEFSTTKIAEEFNQSK